MVVPVRVYVRFMRRTFALIRESSQTARAMSAQVRVTGSGPAFPHNASKHGFPVRLCGYSDGSSGKSWRLHDAFARVAEDALNPD